MISRVAPKTIMRDRNMLEYQALMHMLQVFRITSCKVST